MGGSSVVTNLQSTVDAMKVPTRKEAALVVVYAPWCQFCQAMESEIEKVAADLQEGRMMPTYKLRGDEDRAFVQENWNTESFPTINAVSADGKIYKYESEKRDFESLRKWVEETVPCGEGVMCDH